MQFGMKVPVAGVGALMATTLFGCSVVEEDLVTATTSTPMSECDDADRKTFLETELLRYNSHISDEDRAAKFEAMSADAFAFLRGSAHLFFRDILDAGWLVDNEFDHSAGEGDLTAVWITGDQHMENYGAFQDSKGVVVQGTNDFDEAYVASYLYDLYRMASTICMVSQTNGIDETEWKGIVIDHFVKPYVEEVEAIRQNPSIAYEFKVTKDNAPEPVGSYLAEVEERRGVAAMLNRWTTVNETTGIRYLHRPSRMTNVTAEEYVGLEAAILDYSQNNLVVLNNTLTPAHFAVKDIKNRIRAGIGSRGVARYYILIEGATTSQDDDIILDVKYQPISAPENFIDEETKTRMTDVFEYLDQGERTAEAEVFMNLDPDEYLGHLTFNEQSFLVRQRNPYKDNLDTAELDTVEDMNSFCSQMAKVSAYAHTRSSLTKASSHARNPITWDFAAALYGVAAGKEQQMGEHIYAKALELMIMNKMDFFCFTDLIEEGKLPGGTAVEVATIV